MQEELQEEDDEELDDEEEALILDHDDDQDVYDEDTAIRDVMARETERLQNAAKGIVQEETIDDESVISDEDIEEELGYISPLDSVDPYLAFKRSLSIFQMKNPAGYQASTASLAEEQQLLLAEVMRLAEVKEAEVPVQM